MRRASSPENVGPETALTSKLPSLMILSNSVTASMVASEQCVRLVKFLLRERTCQETIGNLALATRLNLFPFPASTVCHFNTFTPPTSFSSFAELLAALVGVVLACSISASSTGFSYLSSRLNTPSIFF